MCDGGCAKCNAHFMAILNISKICKENVQQRAKKATILSRQKYFRHVNSKLKIKHTMLAIAGYTED